MINIDLEKVASEFSGAILFDGANSFKVIQASEFICFYETIVNFKGETGYDVESHTIYETTEENEDIDINILNKDTINVNKVYVNFINEMRELTDDERKALLAKINIQLM